MTDSATKRRKLRLWCMSDLHVDNAPFDVPPTPEGVDVIVVAGDVADGHVKSAGWLAKNLVSRGKPVMFVPGNHEWHGHDLQVDDERIYEDAGIDVLHWQRPVLIVEETRFVGSTLWTDYNISGDQELARAWATSYMPDLKDIDFGQDRARTFDFSHRHFREWKSMASGRHEGEASATVFITHHAPHQNSLHLEGPPQPSDASFASDLTAEIGLYAPELWVHGHVHLSSDYLIGNTRIVCNPLGAKYKHRGPTPSHNLEFDASKVVEV